MRANASLGREVSALLGQRAPDWGAGSGRAASGPASFVRGGTELAPPYCCAAGGGKGGGGGVEPSRAGTLALAVLAATLATTASALPDDPADGDGLRLAPAVRWQSGDHEIDLHFASRFRWELWSAFANGTDNIYGIRNRVSAGYTWRDRLRVFAEGQHASVLY